MAGLRFINAKQALVESQNAATWVADRRLYVNADRTKVVDEGSSEAAFLLSPGPGHRIPLAEAHKLGLVDIEALGLEKDAEEASDKAASKPADKAVRKPADKGSK